MTPLLIVLSAAIATWLLRILFITVLPADRLPARVRRAFDDVAHDDGGEHRRRDVVEGASDPGG
jgi:hypothetical protein